MPLHFLFAFSSGQGNPAKAHWWSMCYSRRSYMVCWGSLMEKERVNDVRKSSIILIKMVKNQKIIDCVDQQNSQEHDQSQSLFQKYFINFDLIRPSNLSLVVLNTILSSCSFSSFLFLLSYLAIHRKITSSASFFFLTGQIPSKASPSPPIFLSQPSQYNPPFLPLFKQYFLNPDLYYKIQKNCMAQKQESRPQQEQQHDELNHHKKIIANDGLLGKVMKIKINKYNCLTVQVAFIIAAALAPCLHTVITCFVIYNGEEEYFKEMVKGSGLYAAIYAGAQVVLYCNKIVMVAALGALVFSDETNVLNETCKGIVGSFSWLVEVDLALTSALMLVDFNTNCIGFIIAILLYGFKAVLLNYFDRKDMMYYSSIKDAFILSGLVNFTYLLNCFSVPYASFKAFIFGELLVSLLLLAWYINRGNRLIPNPTTQLTIKSLTIAKVSNAIIFLEYLYSSRIIQPSNYALKFALFYLVISFSFSLIFSDTVNFQSLNKRKDSIQLKHLDLFLNILIDDAFVNKAKDHLIRSVIKYHEDFGCGNSKCRSSKVRYDPTTRSHASVIEQNRNRQTSLRYCLKCLYQQAIKEDNNPTLMLDYCQFLLNEFGNIYDICKMVILIANTNLSFLNQLRLAKLRNIMLESSLAFNKTVYQGKLDLQNMITAQQSFQDISNNIEVIVRSNLAIWKAIRKEVINISQIREDFNANLALIDQTNKKWTFLAPYLELQKRWRYIYINYCFFILNKRIFSKDSEQLRNTNQDNFFVGETIFLHPSDPPQRLHCRQVLFDKKSFYIRAFMNGPTLQVITVSKYFQRFVQYSDSEIIGSPIDILMPQEVKFLHDQKVMNWLENGYASDETLYTATFTSFITKNGEEMPAVKYYKLFVNLAEKSMLEFICLLKVNEDGQAVIDDGESQFGTQRSISPSTLKRQFKDGNKNTLKAQNNIFIKNQNLQTNPNIKQIQTSKRSIRFLTASIICLILILMLITNRDTSTINNNITQFLNFLNLYRFPFALTKNYMKYFLALGSQTTVAAQIGVGTQNVLVFNSEPLTIKTLFDPKLNEPKLYPPYKNSTFNKGYSYDQIEIYQVIISCIMSLSKFPINRTGYDFSMVNDYLIPSYDHMINATKIKFHQTFQDNLNIMLIDQVIIALVELVIFVVIVTFVSMKIRAYFSKAKDILLIVFDFSEINVLRVQKYWKRVLKHFQKLNFKNKAYCMGTNLSLSTTKAIHIDLNIDVIKTNMQQQQTISFNRKSKHIQQTKKSHKQFMKYLIIIGISLFLLLMLVLSIELINIMQIFSLINFQKDGYYFLQYYPATSVLGHALMQRYYNQLYPNEMTYSPLRYAQYISDMNLIGQSTYIGFVSDNSSQYYQKRKNYMFGNPCTYNPQVLISANSSVAKCSSLWNQTLTQGLATFLRSAQPTVDQYINGKIKLPSSQLDSLTSALTLVAYYVTDAITTWSSQFSAGILQYQNMGNVLCIATASVILILHLIFCEKMLFYSLQKDYSFVREVFDKMIPQYILEIEKVIKHRLIAEGIVREN